MKYYQLFPILSAGDFYFLNENKIRNVDFGDLYFDFFYTREKKIPDNFVFLYKVEYLNEGTDFDDMDILTTGSACVFSQKFINAIRDEILSVADVFPAVVNYNEIAYNNYATVLIKNICDLFVDDPSNAFNRAMKPKIKAENINKNFDIAIDSETRISVFSQKLIDKLQNADVKFDLKLVPFEGA